jgi:hypothetical protein
LPQRAILVIAAIPTIVFSVKDASGNDATEVTVSMDEQPLLTSLDGTAVPIDPGLHTFRFEMAGQAPVEKKLVLQEGEIGRRQQIEFGSVAPIEPGTIAPLASTTAPPVKNEPVAISHPAAPAAAFASGSGGSSGPWKTVGWVLGGACVVGLGLGTAFGISALQDKNANRTGNACKTGTTGIRSRALVSDVGWIAGGVLLVSGAGLLLFAPRGSHEPIAGVRLSPVVTASGGEIVAGGIW